MTRCSYSQPSVTAGVVLSAVLMLMCHLSAGRASAAATTRAAGNSPPAIGSDACCKQLKALNFSSSIPVVVVQVASLAQLPGISAPAAQLLAKGPHLPATLCTCGAPEGLDIPSVPIELKVRGSTSAQQYAKKSFAMNTLNQNQNLTAAKKEDIRLLGLPADSSWVLHGPENDRTLGMRNWMAYWTSRQMGRYASRTVYYEMFLNTAPGTPLSLQHYWGVYQLQEKVSRGKDRVNVTKFDPAVDMSGGYIIAYENDNIGVDDVPIQLKLTQLMPLIMYPKMEPQSPDQNTLMWITQWLNNFESDLLTKPLSNLSEVLDIPAAIDYFIGTEVTKNPDGYRGSIKMHKDRGGPLVMGPMWDYNEAFGMCCGYPIEGYQTTGNSNGSSGGSAVSAAGWRFNICQDRGRCKVEPMDGTSQWYRKLWTEPKFRTGAAARWAELRKPGGNLSDEAFVGELTRVRTLLGQGPAARNYQKWSTALNTPEYGPSYPNWKAMFDDEVRILTNWIMARLKWLDAAFAKQAVPSAPADAYLSVGYVGPEPELAGADDLQGGGLPAGAGGAGAGGGVPGATAGAAPSQVPVTVASGRHK